MPDARRAPPQDPWGSAGRDAEAGESWHAGSILRPFLKEPALRSVAFAGFGIFVTFGAWMLAMAFRSRSAAALAALVIVALLTAEGVRSELRRDRRPGLVSALLAVYWLFTGATAWAGLHWGLL